MGHAKRSNLPNGDIPRIDTEVEKRCAAGTEDNARRVSAFQANSGEMKRQTCVVIRYLNEHTIFISCFLQPTTLACAVRDHTWTVPSCPPKRDIMYPPKITHQHQMTFSNPPHLSQNLTSTVFYPPLAFSIHRAPTSPQEDDLASISRLIYPTSIHTFSYPCSSKAPRLNMSERPSRLKRPERRSGGRMSVEPGRRN